MKQAFVPYIAALIGFGGCCLSITAVFGEEPSVDVRYEYGNWQLGNLQMESALWRNTNFPE